MDVLRQLLYFPLEWNFLKDEKIAEFPEKVKITYPPGAHAKLKPLEWNTENSFESPNYFSVIVPEQHQLDLNVLPLGARTVILEQVKNYNGAKCVCTDGDPCSPECPLEMKLVFRSINKFIDIERVGLGWLYDVLSNKDNPKKALEASNVSSLVIQRKLGGYILNVFSMDGMTLKFMSKHNLDKSISSTLDGSEDSHVTNGKSIFLNHLKKTKKHRAEQDLAEFLYKNRLFICAEVIDLVKDKNHPLLENFFQSETTLRVGSSTINNFFLKINGKSKSETKDCFSSFFVFAIGRHDLPLEHTLPALSMEAICKHFEVPCVPQIVFTDKIELSVFEEIKETSISTVLNFASARGTVNEILQIASSWEKGNHEGFVFIVEEQMYTISEQKGVDGTSPPIALSNSSLQPFCIFKRKRARELTANPISGHFVFKSNEFIHPLRLKVKTVRYRCTRIVRELLQSHCFGELREGSAGRRGTFVTDFMSFPLLVQLFLMWLTHHQDDNVQKLRLSSSLHWRDALDSFIKEFASRNKKRLDAVVATSRRQLGMLLPNDDFNNDRDNVSMFFILLCGLPGSGKSSLAKLISARTSLDTQVRTLILEKDALLKDAMASASSPGITDDVAPQQRSNQRAWRVAKRRAHFALTAKLVQGKNMLLGLPECSIQHGPRTCVVIVDACNSTVGARRQWRSLFPPSKCALFEAKYNSDVHDTSFRSALVYVKISREVSIQRIVSRSDHTLLENGDINTAMRAVSKVARIFAPPDERELESGVRESAAFVSKNDIAEDIPFISLPIEEFFKRKATLQMSAHPESGFSILICCDNESDIGPEGVSDKGTCESGTQQKKSSRLITRTCGLNAAADAVMLFLGNSTVSPSPVSLSEDSVSFAAIVEEYRNGLFELFNSVFVHGVCTNDKNIIDRTLAFFDFLCSSSKARNDQICKAVTYSTPIAAGAPTESNLDLYNRLMTSLTTPATTPYCLFFSPTTATVIQQIVFQQLFLHSSAASLGVESGWYSTLLASKTVSGNERWMRGGLFVSEKDHARTPYRSYAINSLNGECWGPKMFIVDKMILCNPSELHCTLSYWRRNSHFDQRAEKVWNELVRELCNATHAPHNCNTCAESETHSKIVALDTVGQECGSRNRVILSVTGIIANQAVIIMTVGGVYRANSSEAQSGDFQPPIGAPIITTSTTVQSIREHGIAVGNNVLCYCTPLHITLAVRNGVRPFEAINALFEDETKDIAANKDCSPAKGSDANSKKKKNYVKLEFLNPFFLEAVIQTKFLDF